MSEEQIAMIRRIYHCFNSRDIDAVLGVLSENVAWANGMDGGHVYGRDAVRDYWTRQWALVSPHVEPIGFAATADGALAVTVLQTVFDRDGRPLQGQSHGLTDKTVTHLFRIEAGKIIRFDIGDAL